MKKLILIFFSYLILFNINVYALEYTVSSEEELVSALNSQSELDIINLNNDITLSNYYTITGNVKINGNNHEINYADNYNNKIFVVDGMLELSNIKFNGNNKWSWKNHEDKFNVDVYGNETTLNISDKIINSNVFEVNGNLKIVNSLIYDFYIDNCSNDVNTFIKGNGSNSTIVIDSTTVDNLYGSFIYMINGKVELNNNLSIINSYCLGNKGCLFKQSGGELILNKVTLKDNVGLGRSGSLIGAVSNALVTFNDGLIDNNVAKYHGSNSTGSMITLESGAGFVMNGGVISNNVGTLSSVISTRWTNNPDDRGIILNKGIIRNNTATKSNWLYASIFIRSSMIIGKDMVIDGDVVVNNTNAFCENNGVINGKLSINDSTGKAINNGVIKEVDLLKGEFINNGTINDAYELNNQIINNGEIKDNYIKELTEVEGKILVEFNINGGKEKDTGYTVVDKIYDLNSILTEDDILEVKRDGYTFEGWYTDSEFTNELNLEEELKENIVLYAKWNKIPEVAVPDTHLGFNILSVLIGTLLIFIGSLIIYVKFNCN